MGIWVNGNWGKWESGKLEFRQVELGQMGDYLLTSLEKMFPAGLFLCPKNIDRTTKKMLKKHYLFESFC